MSLESSRGRSNSATPRDAALPSGSSEVVLPRATPSISASTSVGSERTSRAGVTVARRRRAEGRYTVSGPDASCAAPSIGAGISAAQNFAVQHMNDEAGEFTYYVRDLLGEAFARVTKPDGQRVVETYVLKELT